MKLNYKYILIITILTGLLSCNDEDEFPVPESSTTSAKFSFEADPNDVRIISFTNETILADNSGNVSYLWDFGDGSSSSEANPTHTYPEIGFYSARLVVTADDDIDFIEKSIPVIGSLDVQLFYANGSNSTVKELPGSNTVISGDLGEPFGIDYDPDEEKVYFTDNGTGSLYRSDLDGGNLEVLLEGLTAARDVAINKDDNVVYVVDRGTDGNPDRFVYEIDIMTGNSSVLYDESNGLAFLPEAIDYYNGNIYITCVSDGSEAIWKGPVNGAGLVNIIGFGNGGFGYGLAIDKENEKIYFDDNWNQVIKRSDLDGTNIEEVVSTIDNVYGLVVDNVNGLLYWSDSGDGFIKKANLDGTEVQPVSLVLEDPLGIFFIP